MNYLLTILTCIATAGVPFPNMEIQNFRCILTRKPQSDKYLNRECKALKLNYVSDEKQLENQFRQQFAFIDQVVLQHTWDRLSYGSAHSCKAFISLWHSLVSITITLFRSKTADQTTGNVPQRRVVLVDHSQSRRN